MKVTLKAFDTNITLVTMLDVAMLMGIEIKTGLPVDRRTVPTFNSSEANELGVSIHHPSYLPNGTFVVKMLNIRTLAAMNWVVRECYRLNRHVFTENTGTRFYFGMSLSESRSILDRVVPLLSPHDAMSFTFDDPTSGVFTRDYETKILRNDTLLGFVTAKSPDLFELKRTLSNLRMDQQLSPLLREMRIATTKSAIDALRVEMSYGYYPDPSSEQMAARQNRALAIDQRRGAEALARHATPDNNDDPTVPECPLCCEKILDERPIQFKNGDTDQVYHAKCAFQAAIEHKVQKYPYQQTRMSRRNIDQVLESPALRQWQTSRTTRTLAGTSQASSSTPSSSTPPAS
jgi:hypothetical protein